MPAPMQRAQPLKNLAVSPPMQPPRPHMVVSRVMDHAWPPSALLRIVNIPQPDLVGIQPHRPVAQQIERGTLDTFPVTVLTVTIGDRSDLCAAVGAPVAHHPLPNTAICLTNISFTLENMKINIGKLLSEAKEWERLAAIAQMPEIIHTCRQHALIITKQILRHRKTHHRNILQKALEQQVTSPFRAPSMEDRQQKSAPPHPDAQTPPQPQSNTGDNPHPTGR